MGYSLQRPRAQTDVANNVRAFRSVSMGYSLQRPRAHRFRRIVSRSHQFQWATHFNAHAHVESGSHKHDIRKFQWATHFNAHAHILKVASMLDAKKSFNGLLTSMPTRTP